MFLIEQQLEFECEPVVKRIKDSAAIRGSSDAETKGVRGLQFVRTFRTFLCAVSHCDFFGVVII